MLEVLFFGCAVFGGTIMLFQFLLAIIGFGGVEHVDGADFAGMDSAGNAGDIGGGGDGADHGPAIEHHGSLGLFRVVSFRTIVAGLTFFGLGGLAGLFSVEQFGFDPRFKEVIGIAVALVLGISAVYIIYYLYRWMYSLRSDGSVQEKTLIGSKGTVYVKIPRNTVGAGKVLVNHQDRTMEYEAITQGDELKSGTPIIVLRIISGTTVEVART